MNEKQIFLSILGEQAGGDGEPHRVEVETEGRYWEKDGVQYIEYREHAEPGTPSTQVSVAEGIVSLLRRGENATHMVFKRGQRSINAYQTPMGALEMSILPTYMNVSVQPDNGTIDLEYQMVVGGRYAGSNAISIVYRSI